MSEPDAKRPRIAAPGAALTLLDMPTEMLHLIVLHASGDPVAPYTRSIEYAPRHVLALRLISRRLNLIVCTLVRAYVSMYARLVIHYDEDNHRNTAMTRAHMDSYPIHGLGTALSAHLGRWCSTLGDEGSLAPVSRLEIRLHARSTLARCKDARPSEKACAAVAAFGRVSIVVVSGDGDADADADNAQKGVGESTLERAVTHLCTVARMRTRSVMLHLPPCLSSAGLATLPRAASIVVAAGLAPTVGIDISHCARLAAIDVVVDSDIVHALRQFAIIRADGMRAPLLDALCIGLPGEPSVYTYSAELAERALSGPLTTEPPGFGLGKSLAHQVTAHVTAHGAASTLFFCDVLNAIDAAPVSERAERVERAHHVGLVLHASQRLVRAVQELRSPRNLALIKDVRGFSMLLSVPTVMPSAPLFAQCCAIAMKTSHAAHALELVKSFERLSLRASPISLATWASCTPPVVSDGGSHYTRDHCSYYAHPSVVLPTRPQTIFDGLVSLNAPRSLLIATYMYGRAPAQLGAGDGSFSTLDRAIAASLSSFDTAREFIARVATRDLLAERHVRLVAPENTLAQPQLAYPHLLLGGCCTSVEHAFMYGRAETARLLAGLAVSLGAALPVPRLLVALLCAPLMTRHIGEFVHFAFVVEFVRRYRVDLTAAITPCGRRACDVAQYVGASKYVRAYLTPSLA